jgi:hypothetical protein
MESATSAPAWQPLTLGGVASFAGASFGRLFLLQVIVALLVALSVVWAAQAGWFPVIEAALSELPERGEIRHGQLHWTGASPTRLAESTFLSILVDLHGAGRIGQSADVQLELGRTGVKIRSLLGYAALAYPKGWRIALNRAEALSWWGAWHPFLRIGVAVVVIAGLLAGWLVQAALYSIAIRLIAFYSDRAASGLGCLRMAGAALLPGALMMSGAIVLYSLHRLNLVGLFAAWLLHLLIGWVYAGLSPLRLPRLAGSPRRRGNPFGKATRKRS